MGLTLKQAAFVREYLVDLNGTKAAERAGYAKKGAAVTAAKLLRNPKVRAELDAALTRRSERVEVKADDVLRELLRLAMVDVTQAFDEFGQLRPLKDMPADLRRAIASIEVESVSGEPKVTDDGFEVPSVMARVAKVKFWDKTKSLELLGKHLKLFVDRVEHSGALTLEQLVTGAGPAE